MKKEKIVVLGAGLAGLSTAYFLSMKGFDVTVLEKENFIGGLAATVERKGFFLDFGPHPFYTEKKDVLQLFKRLVGKKNFAVFGRDCLLFFNNRYLNYPLTFKNALLQMGIKTTVFAPLSYAKTKIARVFKKKNESFEDWGRESFGDYLFNIFFKPYTEKFWGIPCNKLDATWADVRVSKMSFTKTLLSLFRNKKKVESLIDRDTLPIYYPKKGIGVIAQQLAKAFKRNKGFLLLDQKISSIKKTAYGFEVVSNNKSFSAAKLVSTIPLFDLLPLLEIKKPKKVTEAITQLKKRSLLIGYFTTKKQNILNGSYIYFLDRPYHRITEASKFSFGLSPKGKNSLSFEISCFEGDKFWNMDEKALAKLCLQTLKKDGFLEEKDVLDFFLLKARDAYPVYSSGYKTNLETVLSFLQTIPFLYLLGRQGRYNYQDMDQVIEEAEKLAGKLC